MLNIRTKDEILNKVEELRQDATTAPAAYILFTYLSWEDIPDQYKINFDDEAEKVWAEEEKITRESWKAHIKQILYVLQAIAQGNITVAFGFIPMIIANLWVAKIDVKHIENSYKSVVQTFIDYVDLNRPEAEIDAILTITDILNQIIKKSRIKLGINITNFAEGYINKQYTYDETNKSFLYSNLKSSIKEDVEKGDDIGAS